MEKNRKVYIYIATSLDGYIAKPDDDLTFLSMVEQQGEDYGYADFISSVDTVILGRRTYDWMMKYMDEFPHTGKKTYVITHNPRPSAGTVKFYTGDLRELVLNLKRESGKSIFIDGGAEIVTQLLGENLIDEYIISIIPVLLGDGIRLFKDGRPEQKLKLINSKQFEKGLVQLHYIRSDD